MSKKEDIIEEIKEEEIVEKEEVVVQKKPKEKKIDIKDLPGVGAATAEKLNDSGFNDIMSVAVASPGELIEAAGIGDLAARKIIKAARSKLDMGFESGEDLLKKRQEVVKISTGSKALDAMFGGGIETGAVTEVYGAYGSGKTSIAHQISVNAQLGIDKGGANGAVVWVDSEGTLRPEFIKKIAEAQEGVDAEKILKDFRGVRAFNSDHQMLLTEKIGDLINEGLNVKLVIVDSLMSHFRSEFVGRGSLADRQQKLNKHIHVLLKLATRYNLAVYITNQVMSKPDTFFGDPTVAIGGHVLHHASTYRVYLRRGKKGTRVAKLVDAPAMPETEAIFMVCEEGIKDVM
jgi:DNA repair protein RadA